MKKKKTAVEALIDRVDRYTSAGIQVPNVVLVKLLEGALKAEREQIELAFDVGDDNGQASARGDEYRYECGKQYYEINFKTN